MLNSCRIFVTFDLDIYLLSVIYEHFFIDLNFSLVINLRNVGASKSSLVDQYLFSLEGDDNHWLKLYLKTLQYPLPTHWKLTCLHCDEFYHLLTEVVCEHIVTGKPLDSVISS